LQSDSSLLDVGCSARATFPSSLARSRDHRSPPRRGGGSYPHESIPLSVLHILPAVQPVGWTCSPKVPRPLDDATRASPSQRQGVKPTSVPLSGFLNLSAVSWQARAVRPCFMPLPSELRSPSESSPRAESRTPLGAAGSLAVIHRRAETHPRSPCHRRFRRTLTPRRARWPASPDDYEVPFRPPKRPSRSLWTSAGESRLVATPSPASKLSSSPRVRSRRPESPRSRRPILSWTSAPLKSSPPAPRTLDPSAPRGRRTPQPCERLRAATGDLAAPAPGGARPSGANTLERPPSAVSGPLRGRPGPPLGGRPPPVALGDERTRRRDLRRIEVCGKRRFLRGGAYFSGVSCLLDDLGALGTLKPWLMDSPRGRAPVSGRPVPSLDP